MTSIARPRSEGFTLVEVLVSFVLLSSFFFLIYESVGLGMRYYSHVTGSSANFEQIFLSRRYVKQTIELAQPLLLTQHNRNVVRFRGAPTRVRFVSVQDVPILRRLEWVEVIASKNGDGVLVEVVHWPFDPSTPLNSPAPKEAERLVIVDNATDAEFLYRGHEINRPWQSHWRDSAVLPAQVRIDIDVKDNQWPSLIAAPQVRSLVLADAR